MALPYTHADDDAAEDMSEEARSILVEVDALLADGEAPLPERLARLRALVRKVRPWASRLARMARNHVLRCACTPPPRSPPARRCNPPVVVSRWWVGRT
jgi:hypothetical protein